VGVLRPATLFWVLRPDTLGDSYITYQLVTFR
jgi:hypothetical protein